MSKKKYIGRDEGTEASQEQEIAPAVEEAFNEKAQLKLQFAALRVLFTARLSALAISREDEVVLAFDQSVKIVLA